MNILAIRFVESSRQLSLDTMDGHSYTITFDENDDIQIINNTLDFQSHLTQRGNKENQDSDREEDNNEEQEEIGQIYPRVYGSSTSHNNIFQVFVFKIGSHTIQTYGTLKDRRSFLKFSQNFCGKLDDSTMFGYFKGMVETDACNSTTLPFYTHSITQ